MPDGDKMFDFSRQNEILPYISGALPNLIIINTQTIDYTVLLCHVDIFVHLLEKLLD